MDINPLSDELVNMFSHSVGCLFVLLMVSFAVQKFLVWCGHIYFFSFLFPLPREIYPIKYCYKQCLKFCCLFYSTIFMVSSLTFNSSIHFEFILVCGIRQSSFIFLHISVQFFQHCLLNKLSLAHCMCFLPLLNINWL